MEIRALHTTVGGWRWRALLVKLPVLRWSGGRGRVGAFVRHQAGGGEAVNTLSSLFTISHKFGRPVSRPQCPVSCFPFCCFINKIFGAFLLLLLLLPILSVGTKRSYRASPGTGGGWWLLGAGLEWKWALKNVNYCECCCWHFDQMVTC